MRLEQRNKDRNTAILQCPTLWRKRKFFENVRDPVLDCGGLIYIDVCNHLGYIPEEASCKRWLEKQSKNGGRKMVYKAMQERRNTKMGDIKTKLIGK